MPIDSDDDGDYSGGGNDHYNPDEPRIPAGQTGGNGVSYDHNAESSKNLSIAVSYAKTG